MPSTSPPSPSFATLAERIRGRTTDFLALGILLSLGLAVGWQIMGWLREEPIASPLITPADETPSEVRLLSHGGPLQVDRLNGDVAAARELLRKRCFEVAAQAAPQGEAGPGETKFLARLAKESPREQSEEWALYEPAGEPVMAVLVQRKRQRIVGWGFAFPAEAGSWSCYTFCPGAAVIAPLPGSIHSSGVTQ